MALWICGDCGAAYSVGAPCCPQCGSTDWTEDGMPKIDSAGLATGAAAEPVPVAGDPADAGAGAAREDAVPAGAEPVTVADGAPVPDDAAAPDVTGGGQAAPDETAPASTPKAAPAKAKAPPPAPKKAAGG